MAKVRQGVACQKAIIILQTRLSASPSPDIFPQASNRRQFNLIHKVADMTQTPPPTLDFKGLRYRKHVSPGGKRCISLLQVLEG